MPAKSPVRHPAGAPGVSHSAAKSQAEVPLSCRSHLLNGLAIAAARPGPPNAFAPPAVDKRSSKPCIKEKPVERRGWASRIGAMSLGAVVLLAEPVLGDTVPAGEKNASAQANPPAFGAKAIEEARRLYNAAQKLREQGRTDEAI